MARLERVPPEAQQRVGRVVVWDFDFLRNGVATGDSCLAGVQWSAIHALTGAVAIGIKCIASEPVIAPARLTFSAVRIVTTGLACNICTFQFTLQEAVFGSLFLFIGWKVVWVQEQVD